MAETLKASVQGIHLVAQAGRRKGWTKTRTPVWWEAAYTSQATLRRFWRRLPIGRENFIAICQAVGIDNWEAIADLEAVKETDLPLDIQKGKRTLAAIVFTDAVDFSKRMDADEEKTLSLIDRDLHIIANACHQFEGQVLKTTGDGLLMYFTSAIQAVGCALEIQNSLAELVATLPPEEVLSHRVGIHLGDVFVSEGDVMGNGVNIAARLQTVANPGGICISKTVYDVVKSSLSLKANYLGPQALKNISESVPVYQILQASQTARKERHHQGADVKKKLDSPIKKASTIQQDWGEAPDISTFFGRGEELQKLEDWIVKEGCKVIALLGMGGIGKTTLSVALADHIQDHFDCLIWRSLKPMPPLPLLLKSLLSFLSEGQQPVSSQLEVRQGISQLIERLQQRRCLVILDEAEAIFGSSEAISSRSQEQTPAVGQCREGFEGYADLLRRVGLERHQSCILLTSREKPEEISILEGQNLPVRSLQLRGLQEADARVLLQAKGFVVSERGLTQLVQIYGGSPLALKAIATLIQEVFNGNIGEFLSQNTIVLGDRLRLLLKEQVGRLSPLERDIVYWLTLERNPISLAQLKANFLLPPTQSQLVEALAALERRSLIDKQTGSSNMTFTLQPMVMKYVAEEFIEKAIDEIGSALEIKDLKPFKLLRKCAVIKLPLGDRLRGEADFWMLTRLKDRLQINLGMEIGLDLLGLLPLLRGKPLSVMGYLSRNLLELIKSFEIGLEEWQDLPIR